jgi:ATP-dependent Clp protease adaptor protein ClpS
MSDYHPDYWEGVEEQVEQEVEVPPMYKVLLHNDNYTTMEFVVEILRQVFHKNTVEATRIMLLVHKTGHGVCGVFSEDVAETKVEIVHHLAKESGFPLRCTMEEA